MRKKLALLLALAMVMSVMPLSAVNVFGADALTVSLRGGVRLYTKSGDEKNGLFTFEDETDYKAENVINADARLVVELNASEFNTVSPGGLRFKLSRAAASGHQYSIDFYTTDTITGEGTGYYRPAVPAKEEGGTGTPAKGNIKTTDNQTFEIDQNITFGAEKAYLVISGAIDPSGDNSDLKIDIRPLGRSSFASKEITLATREGYGLEAKVPDGVVNFSDVGNLNDIVISETTIGSLNKDASYTIYLQVSDNFSWTSIPTSIATVSEFGGFSSDIRKDGKKGEPGGHKEINDGRNNLAKYELGEFKTESDLAIGSITISGLKIVADEKTKAGTTAKVTVYIVEKDGGTVVKGDDESKSPKKFDAFDVAKYVNAGLTVDYADKEKTGETTLVYAGDYKAEAATFTITEATVGSFNFKRANNTITFEPVNKEQVKIVSADIWGSYASDADDGKFGKKDNPISAGPDGRYNQEYRLSVDTDYVQFGNVVLGEGKPSKLSVKLTLSIAPDFEDDEVEIEIGGNAIGGDLSKSVISVATVTPRVSVDFDAPSFPAGSSTITRVDLGDITITESEAGALDDNTEIWLYVMSNDNRPPALRAGGRVRVDNEEESGLQVRSVTSTFSSSEIDGASVFGFMVRVSKSSKNDDDEGGVIVIPDVSVEGTMQPGFEYRLVVSGSAVAESNIYTQYLNDKEPISLRDFRRANPATFDTAIELPIFSGVEDEEEPEVEEPEVEEPEVEEPEVEEPWDEGDEGEEPWDEGEDIDSGWGVDVTEPGDEGDTGSTGGTGTGTPNVPDTTDTEEEEPVEEDPLAATEEYIKDALTNLGEKPAQAPGTAITSFSRATFGFTMNKKEIVVPSVVIGGSNFVMLRNIAILLNSTNKQFSIDFIGDTAYITTGEPFDSDETSPRALPTIGGRDGAKVVVTQQKVNVNGIEVPIAAYNIGGGNYVRLRDMCMLLNIYIQFVDPVTPGTPGLVVVDTESPYPWKISDLKY